MNVVQEIKRINEQELAQGLTGKASWHHEYKDSAWVFAGGFPYDLTEGDVLCVMSQWGEIEDINLCREKDTGKSKGFCFIKYEDQRSTILAVDNFNGMQLLGRTIRVDHKHKYSLPKEVREREEKLEEERVAQGEAPKGVEAQWRPGVAYEGKQLASAHNFHKGVDVFAAPEKGSGSSDDDSGLDGGGLAGESAEEKRKRKEAKRARKEARRDKRERKKHKDEKKKKNNKDSVEHRHRTGDTSDGYKKRKKHTKKDGRGDGEGGDGDTSTTGSTNKRRRDNGNDDRSYNVGESSRADAAQVWERGQGAPKRGGGGGGDSGGSYGSGSAAAGRAEAPPSLSLGNVLDWRGLAGQSGGRGGRDGGRRGGGGRGAGGGGRDGGRSDRGGRSGINSFGGMDRRR
ncbi:unnamed protein product [Sphacelaria rigidula]